MRKFFFSFLLSVMVLGSGITFGDSVDLPLAKNLPSNFRFFLTQAFEELTLVKGNEATELHREIFGGDVSGELYKKWFQARVRRIELDQQPCHGTARVDSAGEKGIIYVCPKVNLNPSSALKVYWLLVLFHEARHLESDHKHWKHDVVLDGFGMPQSLDHSPLGAFGLEKVMAFNLAHFCQNCSEDFKQQALKEYESDSGWKSLSPQASEILRLDEGL